MLDSDLTHQPTAAPAQASDAPIEIKEITDATGRTAFMKFAVDLYKDDPAYVAPLYFELGQRLDPNKNPLLKKCAHALYMAYQDGAPVGRISIIKNVDHLNRHNDGAAHFGFFECVEDQRVANALINKASNWAHAQSLTKLAGPYNFSVNEECGLLIDGFDTPPYIMMPHGKPYYSAMLDALGFTTATEMIAYSYTPVRQFIPEKRMKFIDRALKNKNIEIRNKTPGKLHEDVSTILNIFNDAWSDNYGFVPFNDDHAKHMADELAPIIREKDIVICYLKDEPVAFGLVLPNIHEASADFNGKLLPFNWAKLLWRLKVSGIKSSRMPLMGVKKQLQGKPLGAALAYKIIDLVNGFNMDQGVNKSELSWILKDNLPMRTMLEEMGSDPYKTYRIYTKDL